MADVYDESENSPRPVACLNCRKRRSYCSKDKPKCLRCHESSLNCVYEESRKITVNESYLKDLERKAQAFDRKSRDAYNSSDAVPSDEDEYRDFGQDHLLEPFAQVHIDKASTGYKGPGSSESFLESVSKLSGFCRDDGSFDNSWDLFDQNALPCRRGTLPVTLQLPPPDVARRLFEAQHYYIGTIFAFTPPDMLNHLPLLYRGPPDPTDRSACAVYAKLLIILAFGQMYSVNQWVGSRGPPGFDYFVVALDYLPEPYEEGSIASVETLALTGYFMQNLNRRDAAFRYVGMALRIAVSLGLHQEVRAKTHGHRDKSQGPADLNDMMYKERRRRVWWSIYSLDRILCVKSGNPISILDEDIDVNLPSKLPNEPAHSPVVALRHYTQLSRILGQIHTNIYSRSSASPSKSGKELMASVQGIILSLSNWDKELPNELRFHPVKLKVNLESVSIFAHYYQCINMTVRPLLFHVLKSRLQAIRSGEISSKEVDWRDSLSFSTVRMIDICIGGAQDVISMMQSASRRNLVATYGYMDGEHISSATIVLVMACEALPHNDANVAAMRGGLDLLRKMSERGNSQMGARYELLGKITSRTLARQDIASPSTSTNNFGTATSQTSSVEPDLSPAPTVFSSTGRLSNLSRSTSVAFPVIDNRYLGEPFFSENSINTGRDFQLWEEGFANPMMDSSFDLPQWTHSTAPGKQAEDILDML